jgi:hypothetical protein
MERHATMFMVLHYTKFVNLQWALAGHGDDGWGCYQ